MERFYGLDLGDAESAVARLDKKDPKTPEMLSVGGVQSFITAYAKLVSGELLIGEKACYRADTVTRKLRFKSRFLTSPTAEEEITAFAAGLLGELYTSGSMVKGDDSCFYVGCPAGWDKNTRERYRAIFEQAGYPPTRIVSESRAAMVSACQSKHLQVGYDILNKPVLVVDIGSSTTDFAYVCGGREVEMHTAGEVALGGGQMDEMLLEDAVAASPKAKEIREVFAQSEPWKNYCEFAARRLKEKYYSDESYWKENPCTETIQIFFDKPLRLTLKMDEVEAKRLTDGPCQSLGNQSFRYVFIKSLRDVREHISGEKPELLFLTGGVSRLPAIRQWCAEVFPEAVVIRGTEPEFAVARGLAWSGKIDEEMREFRAELEQLKSSTIVEKIVREHIGDLYHDAVDVLVEPILTQVAVPTFEKWRNGEIRRLADTDEVMRNEIANWLRTDEARGLLTKCITSWLRPVADELEEYTEPICIRHSIPFTALSLNSYLSASDLDLRIDAKNVFAVEEVTWMIDSIISLLVALICGGGGVALVSSGLTGILIGAFLSMLVLLLGKEQMQGALLKADLPRPMRKMVPRNSFSSRMKSVSADVKASFFRNLEEEKNDEITARMEQEISEQIELCLTRMAEVVEIPLG